jgi:hypothetical protein
MKPFEIIIWRILSLACLPFHHARRLDAGKDAIPSVRLKPAFRRPPLQFRAMRQSGHFTKA